MENDIVVITHNGNLYNTKIFLQTFSNNCIDKNSVVIRLIVPKFSHEIFSKLIKGFPELKIIIHTVSELLSKHEQTKCTELQLLETIGKTSFISLKKILGILESSSDNVCVFNSNTIFIRKFSLTKYISNNNFKYYFCSKLTCRNGEPQKNIIPLQVVQNSIIGVTDNNWYREVRNWIFNKKVVSDLYNFLITKYQNLCGIERNFVFDYCYYLFYKYHNNMYPVISWIDTYYIINNLIPFNKFSLLCDRTPVYSLLENSGSYIAGHQDEIPQLQHIYTTLNIPIFGCNDDVEHQLFLLSSQQIFMIYGNYGYLLQTLINNNAFNLKIALGISGIIRMCDDVSPLLNFIGSYEADIFFYLSLEDATCQTKLTNIFHPKCLIVDNGRPYISAVAKIPQPTAHNVMVATTCSMFYKKRKLVDIIPTDYDIIVHLRPDLLSLDGKQLMHVILNILLKYKKDVLYIPKIYHSFGITDTLAIGSYNIMYQYLKLYDKMDTYIDNYIFNPEYLVYKHVTEAHIKIDTFDWFYKIFRHPAKFLELWWRFEFDIENCLDEYLRLKTQSFETYIMKFIRCSKKRCKIKNKKTRQFIYIDNEVVTLNNKKCSQFFISHQHDILMRINIKYDTTLPNVNNDNTGWNLYVPTDNILLGKGNNNAWAQFYIIAEDDHFYLATFHTHHAKNCSGTFGRYLGVIDNHIVTDLPRCAESQWMIK